MPQPRRPPQLLPATTHPTPELPDRPLRARRRAHRAGNPGQRLARGIEAPRFRIHVDAITGPSRKPHVDAAGPWWLALGDPARMRQRPRLHRWVPHRRIGGDRNEPTGAVVRPGLQGNLLHHATDLPLHSPSLHQPANPVLHQRLGDPPPRNIDYITRPTSGQQLPIQRHPGSQPPPARTPAAASLGDRPSLICP